MTRAVTDRLGVRGRALLGALMACLLVASSGQAEPSDIDKLAIAANHVHLMYCAEMYGKDIGAAAAGYQEVGKVLGDLSDTLESSEQHYLLYWRGLLAECLGQYDQAVGDLVTFIVSFERSPGLSEMVRDARQRVERIRALQAGANTNVTASIGAPIAFLPDPRAASVLKGYELQRYRRSGMLLDAWIPRRFSLKGRAVLLIGGGALWGPVAEQHDVVEFFYHSNHLSSSTLVAGWGPSGGVGVEGGLTQTVYLGGSISVAVGFGAASTTQSGSFISIPDEDVRFDSTHHWIAFAGWLGFNPLPLKRVHPLVRVGAQYRPSIGHTGGNAAYGTSWHVGSVVGFAGIVVEGTHVPGIELGCWVSWDWSANLVVETDLEQISPDMESRITPAAHGSVAPSVMLRFPL